jgi:hypothetical protein
VSNEPQDTTANHELVELLDRVIDTGVVVSGDLRLSVAGIELIYINLRALIASSDRVIEEQGLEEQGLEEQGLEKNAPHTSNQSTPKTDNTHEDTHENAHRGAHDNTHEDT